MSFRAVGINSHKEYAMAASRAQLMRQLTLIYPSFDYHYKDWHADTKPAPTAKNPVLPEVMMIEKE